MPRDLQSLIDIAGQAELIDRFTKGRTLEDLTSDDILRSAILHQLTVMGEAVRRLSEPFKLAHAEVPWAKVQGLRNIVVHEYDDVDLNIVWVTVTTDVPRLAAWVAEYITREGGGQ